MVTDIIDRPYTTALQGEAERLRQTAHAPDMDDIGLKHKKGLAQRLIVVQLQSFEGIQFQPRIAVAAVNLQTPLHIRFRDLQAMIGSQHLHFMPTHSQRFGDRSTAQRAVTEIMRGVKVGENKNLHEDNSCCSRQPW